MGEFFKGRRRKFGVVTLVIACVFTAAWVKSTCFEENITVVLWQRAYQFISERGYVCWKCQRVVADEDINEFYSRQWHCDPIGQEPVIKRTELVQIVGFDYEEHRHALVVTVFTISYTLMVLPPTLLSAYLILTKPRSANFAEEKSPSTAQSSE